MNPTPADRSELVKDFGRPPTSSELDAISKLIRVVRIQSLMLVLEGTPLPESVRE